MTNAFPIPAPVGPEPSSSESGTEPAEPPPRSASGPAPPLPVGPEEQILISLRRIIRAVDLQSRDLLRRVELTIPQLTCLRFLASSGLTNAGELARGVSLSQGTITGIVDRLARRGLVDRRRSSVDRRVVLIELTPTGREVVASVPAPLQERLARHLVALPEERRQQIARTLDEVVAMMEAEGLDASPVLTPEGRITSGPAPTGLDEVPAEPVPSRAGIRAASSGGGP